MSWQQGYATQLNLFFRCVHSLYFVLHMLVPFTSSLLTHTRTHTHTCTSKTTPPFQTLVHEIFLCRCCPFLHSSLMRAGASVIMLMCPEALHSLSIYHESFVFHSTVAGALWHERKLEQERVCVCVRVV